MANSVKMLQNPPFVAFHRNPFASNSAVQHASKHARNPVKPTTHAKLGNTHMHTCTHTKTLDKNLKMWYAMV